METHLHKILSNLVATRLDGPYIDRATNIIDIFRKAEKDDRVYMYNGSTLFCSHLTDFNGEPAIILVFSISLDAPVGNSNSNETVMAFISFLERTFTSNYEIKMMKYGTGDKERNYALISIIIDQNSISK